MAIERMLTEAEPPADVIGRVLHEVGIEYVFGISGGHTSRIITGWRNTRTPSAWSPCAKNRSPA